jgi:hypothetical protein
MNTTVRDDAAIVYDASNLDLVCALVMVHHPSTERVGVRRVVTRGAPLDLGRACGAFGEGAFDEPLVSRVHARVEEGADGALRVSDLGSANGTWVNGERVAHAVLREGAVLRVGSVLLVAQRAPATYPLRRSARAPAVAWRTVEFVERLRERVRVGAAVRVRGAPRSAWWPYVAHVAESLGRTPDALDVTAGDGADALTMPALTARVEDIPWLVRDVLARAVGRVPEMDAGFVTRLLRAAWPEDVDGVTRWAEAVAQRPERHGRLTWVGEDLAHTGGPRDEAPVSGEVPRASAAVRVARDGAWFQRAGEAPVYLRARYALARVLRALVDAHARAAAAPLALEALIDAGWPGERPVADSGANRVYVAIATLRRLGMREHIERLEGGYRLALGVELARPADVPAWDH